MKKINCYSPIEKQIEMATTFYQFEYKQMYIDTYNKLSYDILSYSTKVMEYLPLQNVLYVTKKKYSITTSKQQTQIINFMKRIIIKKLQLYYKIINKKWLYSVLFYKINIFFLIIIKNYIIYIIYTI